MKTFNYTILNQKKWDNEIIGYVAKIHEYRAKQDIFLKQKPAYFTKLVELAKVQSTQASNEIEGIRTTSQGWGNPWFHSGRALWGSHMS